MYIYYPILLIIAILFYLLLSYTFSLPGLIAFLSVFFAFFLSAIFPGIISQFTPTSSLLLLFFMTLSGGTLLYSKGIKGHRPHTTQKEEREPSSSFHIEEKLRMQEGIDSLSAVLEKNGEGKEAYTMDVEDVVQEIIERAFKAKDGGDYLRSTQLLKTVLKKSNDTSTKGLVLSEMVFLYKKMGKYLEGARFISDFLEEEESFRPSLHEHFLLISKYLRELDSLLVKAQCPDIPYDQVSQLIRARAEKILK